MRTLASVVRACARVLLGLFVVGQLGFLLVANFLGVEEPVRKSLAKHPRLEALAPDYLAGKGSVQSVLRDTESWTRRWSQLTGQPQSWRLFAPNVTDTIPFVAVELVWDDPPAERRLLLSENEPADVRRYVKLGHFRLRRAEAVFDCLSAASENPFRADSLAWADGIRDLMREEHAFVHAYLRWRLDRFLRQHPDLPPPAEVILYVRIYRIPPPPGPSPWQWEYLGQHPVARWLPRAEPDPGHLPIEVYNPVVDRFEAMER
jgi:hypothetical protein